jgi:hypothetical protein
MTGLVILSFKREKGHKNQMMAHMNKIWNKLLRLEVQQMSCIKINTNVLNKSNYIFYIIYYVIKSIIEKLTIT